MNICYSLLKIENIVKFFYITVDLFTFVQNPFLVREAILLMKLSHYQVKSVGNQNI